VPFCKIRRRNVCKRPKMARGREMKLRARDIFAIVFFTLIVVSATIIYVGRF